MSSRLLWILIAVAIVAYVFFFYRTFVGPYSFRWKALYGTTTYPSGTVRGLDISHYQEAIDWEKLRHADIQGAPVKFVFIKATEGTDQFDAYFNLNFAQARRCGIVRGAYHFFSTKSSARRQAEYFCRMVQLEEGDLPPVLDVEVEVDKIEGYSRKKLQDEVKTWLDIVEEHYRATPILYASYAFKEHYLNTEDFDRYPYWIAHYYVDTLRYAGRWTFWQHTDAGKVDGIGGRVDVNLFNGTEEQLDSLCICAN